MTLTELQQQAHALACEKGWWDGERDPDEVFSNFHAEIAEAWEEYRSGRPITEAYSYCYIIDLAAIPPDLESLTEGFFVELADLVIRIADAAQAWGFTKLECDLLKDTPVPAPTVANLVCRLHWLIADAQCYVVDETGAFGEQLSICLSTCFAFAKQHNVDLWSVIRLKSAFNATRPRKHNKIA